MEATAPRRRETSLGPTDEPHARRSPSTSRRPPLVASIVERPRRRPSSRRSTCIASDPTLKPVIDQLDQALGLIGGADAALGWVGDTAIVVNAPDGTPEGGVIIVPTDKAAADHLFTALQLVHRARWRPAGHHRHTRRPTTARRSRSSTWATSPSSPGWPARPARPACRPPSGHVQIAYAVTDQVVVVGSGPASSSTSSTRPRTRRSRRTTRYKNAGRPGRRGHRARRASTSPTIRELVEKAACRRRRRRLRSSTRPMSSRSSRRSTRSSASSSTGATSTRPVIIRHRQVSEPRPASRPHEEEDHTHGSPHQADARRRDQAADLPGRRRRRPQRPRWARDRDSSATTTRAPSRSSSSSTPTRRRRGSPRAPSRPIPSLRLFRKAGIVPAAK